MHSPLPYGMLTKHTAQNQMGYECTEADLINSWEEGTFDQLFPEFKDNARLRDLLVSYEDSYLRQIGYKEKYDQEEVRLTYLAGKVQREINQ